MQRSSSRKKHSKSRRGCALCKSRHVKCDELRPSCLNCCRLGLTCVYNQKPISEALSSTSNPAIDLPVSTESTTHPHTAWSSLDLQLLYHYVTCCCVPAPGEKRKNLWTRDIVTISFDNEYLLHQILAVSALHQYNEDTTKTDIAIRGAEHRARALILVRPVLTAGMAESAIPVFGFAGLTMIYAFAEQISRIREEGENYDVIRHASECCQLNRGISTVVKIYHTELRNSWAKDLITLESTPDFDRLKLLGQRLRQTDLLHALIDSHETRPEQNAAYHEALDPLTDIIMILSSRDEQHESLHLINAWPSTVRLIFWQSLDAKEPVALVIMAYFAVALSLRPKLWWFRGWPGLLIKEIHATLGSEWEEALAWPTTMIKKQFQDTAVS